MIKGKSIIAIIPARGGSTRVPGKNLAPIGGVSMVRRAVTVAQSIEGIDTVVVSSDDAAILSEASVSGAQALRRPDALSGDTVRTAPVLVDVLDRVKSNGQDFDYVLLLEPTSPLRTAATVERVIHHSIEGEFDAVGTLEENRDFFWKRSQDDTFVPLFPDAPNRSQERDPLYIQAGVCYVTRSSLLRAQHTVLGGRCDFVVVDRTEALDVNTPLDLQIAAALADTDV